MVGTYSAGSGRTSGRISSGGRLGVGIESVDGVLHVPFVILKSSSNNILDSLPLGNVYKWGLA